MHLVFTPYEFGGVGDGITKDTAAVQSAIDACSEKGGRVILSNGKFVCGTLFLRSNVTFEVKASAAFGDQPEKPSPGRTVSRPS